MSVEGIGSSVVIALAAVLWLVYLIPTWFRRREYLTTERNAVRLQQTIRVMAEAAEVPETVRLEANARVVAEQQRLLRIEQDRVQAVARAKEAAARRAAAATMASLQPAVAAEAIVQSAAAQRLRRSRAITTGVLASALIVFGVGFAPVAASASLLWTGGVVAVASIALLTRMSQVGRRRAEQAARVAARPARPRSRPTFLDHATVDQPAVQTSWTPVPIPKPLYLSKPAAQTLVSDEAVIVERQRLLEAAALAEREQREAERAEKVTPIIRPAADSRFARMGIVDDTTGPGSSAADLDAVLRRRRSVG